jgi:hypothetical protein
MTQDNGKTYKAFELSRDRSESNDVYADRPIRVAELIEKYEAWESTLMPQQWGWNSRLGYKDPNFGKPKPYHAPGYFESDQNSSKE